MCGILGVLPANDLNIEAFTRARDSLLHRGPDAGSNWICPNHHILLGHRRLAVIDLSPAGSQPMHSSCGRFVLVFNGEIYNHRELRLELDLAGLIPENGWKGHSDTETLLACFAFWGFEPTLKKLTGMFALALWDRRKKSLCLARDRMGEKPLYYGLQGSRLVFSSEIKAFKHLPGFNKQINPTATSLYLHNNFIPAPHSIYKGIFKLLPGAWLEVSHDNIANASLPEPTRFWSATEKACHGQAHPFQGTLQEACDELEYLLESATKGQMLADVSVGAFLSGGIDSSTIVALMQKSAPRPVTTLSIGIPNSPLDESRHAAEIAKHLGTHHLELHVSVNDALSIIPNLQDIWDEPFGDSSQLPTWLVCKLAKGHVTVALSGDGGDELFFGYPHHSRLSMLWYLRWVRHLPWESALRLHNVFDNASRATKVESLRKAWQLDNPLEFITFMSDHYRDLALPIRNASPIPAPTFASLSHMESNVALHDTISYLPDDILVKVDRAAMSVSLETRAPLLDYRVVEFALSLPPSYKHRHGVTKKVLRETLSRHVPKKMTARPKQGFSVPVAHWMRNELKEWSEEMLEKIRRNPDFWNYKGIEAMWTEHQTGKHDHSQRLWGAFALVPFLE